MCFSLFFTKVQTTNFLIFCLLIFSHLPPHSFLSFPFFPPYSIPRVLYNEQTSRRVSLALWNLRSCRSFKTLFFFLTRWLTLDFFFIPLLFFLSLPLSLSTPAAEFDKRYGPTFHCVVGRNFGSYVTHETKHFIYFYLGQVAVLLFKVRLQIEQRLFVCEVCVFFGFFFVPSFFMFFFSPPPLNLTWFRLYMSPLLFPVPTPFRHICSPVKTRTMAWCEGVNSILEQ